MERYNRNILTIGEEGQKRLLNSKVLVCGCGGLGSTVITNLACLGIGTIGLVDNDKVEITNLNRQFLHKETNEFKVLSAKKWINEYNQEINVNTYQMRLDENNFGFVKEYDLIIDCFDSFKSKFLLNNIAQKTGQTLIHGGVSDFYGQVTIIMPNKTPCLECFMPYEDIEESKGIISPTVSIIGSIQSMESAKLIAGVGENLNGTLLTYNGLTEEFKKLKITKNSNCTCCKNFA